MKLDKYLNENQKGPRTRDVLHLIEKLHKDAKAGKPIGNLLETIIDKVYEQGREEGYESGYDSGYDAGASTLDER